MERAPRICTRARDLKWKPPAPEVTRAKEEIVDKRLAFGRIVGKLVRMKETGETGTCEFYDRCEHVFLIALKSYENEYNPDGICTCDRDAFEVM